MNVNKKKIKENNISKGGFFFFFLKIILRTALGNIRLFKFRHLRLFSNFISDTAIIIYVNISNNINIVKYTEVTYICYTAR